MLVHNNRPHVLVLASALFGLAMGMSPTVHAATFIIINNDAPNVGLNDPTPAAPVGGNPGTTVGQQRLFAFQRAADLWGERLASNVTIRIRAQFGPQSCTQFSGVIASAGAFDFARDFPGAPVPGTWYHYPLADALQGTDIDPPNPDIVTTFNGNIGTPGCLTALSWYYGFDAQAAGNQLDVVTIAMHEFAHGLGFSTLVNLQTGAKAGGFDDAYMRHLEHHGASPPDYPSMSNAQRVAASTSVGNLHWTGPFLRAASGILTVGRTGDHVHMNATNPAQPGSSVSHFDQVLQPPALMRPSYTHPIHDTTLELPLFQDLGWALLTPSAPLNAVQDFNADERSDILWRHVSGAAAMWLMNTAQTIGGGDLGNPGSPWQVVGTGDFNGDGRSDILWRHVSGATAMWLMNGAQVIGQGGWQVDPTWQVVGTGDFNGDGRSDILWRHASGATAMWQMNGAQVIGQGDLGTVAAAWQVVRTGDFNGDGRVDILWRHASGTTAVWLMNGAQVISQGGWNVDTAWQVAGTGDFNGDGRVDILWRHVSGATAMWLLNGAQVIGGGDLGAVDLAWQASLFGDFNGDKRSDLLWRHTSGSVAMWLLNGAQVIGGGDLGLVDPSWQIQGLNAN